MAKIPNKQKKPDTAFVTTKIRSFVYNQLVSLRKDGESLSDVIKRHLPETGKKGGARISVKLA